MRNLGKRSIRILVYAIGIAAALYLAALILLSIYQERMIFFGKPLAKDFQFQFQQQFEERYLAVDGLQIHSLLFMVPGSKNLILYFHGNAGNLAGWGQAANELMDHTATSVWIVDYPGFGKSDGAIHSEDQLHAIGNAFLRAASQLVAGSNHVIVYGRSIGTGLAVPLAAQNQVAGLILEAPFYNLENIAEMQFPWVPSILLKYQFHSEHWIGKVTCPTLIVQGDQDEVIPYTEGRKLAGEAKLATVVTIVGSHHNDLGESAEFWSAIVRFFDSINGR